MKNVSTPLMKDASTQWDIRDIDGIACKSKKCQASFSKEVKSKGEFDSTSFEQLLKRLNHCYVFATTVLLQAHKPVLSCKMLVFIVTCSKHQHHIRRRKNNFWK